MGLSVQEIAQLVVQSEPAQCPYCKAENSFVTAMAQVVEPPEGLEPFGEAVVITYLCDNCKEAVLTFA